MYKFFSSKPTEILTERLVLAPIRDCDESQMIRLLTDETVTKTYMVPIFEDYGQAERLFRMLKSYSAPDCPDRFFYGVFLDGELVGIVNDCGYSAEKTEIGYAFLPKYYGRGFATEAFLAVIKQLFDMGCHRVIAGYFEENGASRRVIEKCGLLPNGKTEIIEYRGVKHNCIYCEIENSGRFNHV